MARHEILPQALEFLGCADAQESVRLVALLAVATVDGRARS